jgi:hypothetical protein
MKKIIFYIILAVLSVWFMFYQNRVINQLQAKLTIGDTVFVSKVITDTIKVVQAEKKAEKKYVGLRKPTKKPELRDSVYITEFQFKDKNMECNVATFWARDSATYTFDYILFPDTLKHSLEYRNSQINDIMTVNDKEYKSQIQTDNLTAKLTEKEKPKTWNNIFVGFGIGIITAFSFCIWRQTK